MKGFDMRALLWRISYVVSLVIVAITLAAWPVLALAQQVADTLPGPIPPSGPISTVATFAIGIGAAALTALVRRSAKGVDSKIGSVDQVVKKAIGPLLPVVAYGIAEILPQVLHTTGIAGDIAVNAPVSAIVGIVSREALRKWILPLLGKGY